MYIERNIDCEIENWSKTDYKGLMIFGARQIGKTESIRHFLRTHYKLDESEMNLPEFNLSGNDNKFKKILLESKNNEDKLIEELFAAATNMFNYEKCDVILIDEVQELANDNKNDKLIKTIIKKVLNIKYKIIFSGSMLGAFLNNLLDLSKEIENLSIKKMYPFTLIEFIYFFKKDTDSINRCIEILYSEKTIPVILHTKMLKYFIEFGYIGGMPDTLNEYLHKANIIDAIKSISGLRDTYYLDVEKYFKDISKTFDKDLLFKNLFEGFKSIDKKTFIKKKIKDKRYFYNYILKSDVGLLVPHIEEKDKKLSEQLKPKSYLNDVGFLRNIMLSLPEEDYPKYYKDFDLRMKCTFNRIDAIGNEKMGKYEGLVFEQVVAQELKAKETPFYYDFKKMIIKLFMKMNLWMKTIK